MPLLSDRTMTWQLVNLDVIRIWIASSTATISTQPILQLSEFHPSLNCQANHFPLRISPIPQPVDVSTNNAVARNSGGWMIFIPTKSLLNRCLHQAKSKDATVVNLCFASCEWWFLKPPQNLYKETRQDRPSDMTKEMWLRVLMICSVSLAVWREPKVQEMRWFVYFCFFFLGKFYSFCWEVPQKSNVEEWCWEVNKL